MCGWKLVEVTIIKSLPSNKSDSAIAVKDSITEPDYL